MNKSHNKKYALGNSKITLALFLALTTLELSADTFKTVLSSPDVTVIVPELPQIEMKKHPLSENKPHLRLLGNSSGYNISVITPTADQGVTSKECASWRIGSLIKQFGLKKSHFIAKELKDRNTYTMYFPVKFDKFIQLNAYLLSSHNGNYCIEVHISKVTDQKEELINWHESFPNARIKSN